MTKENKLIYFGVFPGLVFQLIGAILYFVIFAESGFAQAIYSATKILILIWPLVWWMGVGLLWRMHARPERAVSFGYGLLAGIAIALLMLSTFFLFQDFFAQFAPQFLQKAQELNFLEHYILFAVFLSLAHSLIEEYYWRWFIFRGLMLKFQPVTAALIGSIAFASHHFIVLSQFFPFWITMLFGTAIIGIGLFWCWLYYKTKSLLGPWISHIFADVAIMIAGYFLLF
ncbi:hypothetical protein COV82_05840 [Candidatus Peregrinibacteria bacterium CG11_big_fil_rev_8_21_14_0_20_46_8]|nr:MAG: hypothetical protein COV82_05840 [Candidatus Peregrinibacteria bacterium CG11_big_fil_rev_8_21_14_0_20_46_8]